MALKVFPDGSMADSGAQRTSAVPAKADQPCVNPWCEGRFPVVNEGCQPLTEYVARNVRNTVQPRIRAKKRDFGGENRYDPAQGFCFASIGPRFSPFVVVLLPRKISTLFDSA
jgi:hypothetical protein